MTLKYFIRDPRPRGLLKELKVTRLWPERGRPIDWVHAKAIIHNRSLPAGAGGLLNKVRITPYSLTARIKGLIYTSGCYILLVSRTREVASFTQVQIYNLHRYFLQGALKGVNVVNIGYAILPVRTLRVVLDTSWWTPKAPSGYEGSYKPFSVGGRRAFRWDRGPKKDEKWPFFTLFVLGKS